MKEIYQQCKPQCRNLGDTTEFGYCLYQCASEPSMQAIHEHCMCMDQCQEDLESLQWGGWGGGVGSFGGSGFGGFGGYSGGFGSRSGYSSRYSSSSFSGGSSYGGWGGAGWRGAGWGGPGWGGPGGMGWLEDEVCCVSSPNHKSARRRTR